MKALFILCGICIVIFSCKPIDNEFSAQEIIDKSISASGVEKIANAELSFKFRDKYYIASRKNGIFNLNRVFIENNDSINDVISNSGFERIKNSKPIKVQDSMALKYSESINSVHYFSVLPFGLNDKAVKKNLLGESEIKGKNYYKIKITFLKEGGGVDYNDVFIYWIEKENFLIGYFAYTFKINGGGKRFREVRNEHLIDGIRFVDYTNYKPKDNNIKLYDLDQVFQKDELMKVSEINLSDIQITFN